MSDLAEAFDGDRRMHVGTSETLHLKGLLGQDYYLSGSMNLTFGGLETNDEGVTFIRDLETVAKMRLHFVSSYGVAM
jgi:phosphatidylserine/phosphatidylglycerophosphate/cardiolipin synthase-like enzyme